MLRFSAHLSTLFTELPLAARFAAAARAGFEAVEIWSPYEMPAEEMADLLRANGLQCVGINSAGGDTLDGERGLAVDPGRRHEFLHSVEQAMEYARAIDCANVHVLAGAAAAGSSPAEAWQVYRHNLGAACDIAQRHGRVVMIEALNAIDRPNYLLTRQEEALAVVSALGRDNLRILFDLFHVQRGQGNLIERLRASLPHAAHVQIADVPGRHEPGTGEINFPRVFAELESAGYAGWIGCEYLPLNSTAEGLGWREAFNRPAPATGRRSPEKSPS
jgi:hydroxypyruvate isomerase